MSRPRHRSESPAAARRRRGRARRQAAGDRRAASTAVSTPCCRAAASSRASRAADAAVRELAEECSLEGTVVRHLFDGDHGGRAASYFLVDVPRASRCSAAPRPRSSRTTTTSSRSGRRPASCRCSACFPTASPTWSWTRSGRCGSTRPAPDEWPVVERLWQLYQHDLSEFRHSSPGPDGLFQARRLPRVRRGWTTPGRVPRPARRRAVRLRAGARRRPRASG